MMAVTRIYNGDDGMSHFADIEPPFGESLTPVGAFVSAPAECAKEITFHRAEPGASLGWHAAPQRQHIFFISGEVEIETGDGTVRGFGAGTVILVEDVTGKGHLSTFVGIGPCYFAIVPLAE